MKSISKAVGNLAPNLNHDVITIQRLLNDCIRNLVPCLPLDEDGDCGPITIGVIKSFQRRIMQMKKPDGRVDPGKGTIKKLNLLGESKDADKTVIKDRVDHLLVQVQNYWVSPAGNETKLQDRQTAKSSKSKTLTESDFKNAATQLGVEVAIIKAVATVESAGGGFLTSGNPKVLFEGHWFSKLTKGIYDKKHPTISYPRWTKKHYRGGEKEFSRYQSAAQLDKTAAQKSTSWGKFQIMGFNHRKAGFADVGVFVKAMSESEGKQLIAFINFLKSTKLDGYLKTKDWAKFAKRYNGPKYAENKYDIRLKQAYEAFSSTTK